ncbi:hypothetical protein DL765_000468 [Monosporascus sp. GIB2]|nr:hypothetical protein DL765_000468 [Monosporascus sp. GIB2]
MEESRKQAEAMPTASLTRPADEEAGAEIERSEAPGATTTTTTTMAPSPGSSGILDDAAPHRRVPVPLPLLLHVVPGRERGDADAADDLAVAGGGALDRLGGDAYRVDSSRDMSHDPGYSPT